MIIDGHVHLNEETTLAWDPPFGIRLSYMYVENIMRDNMARLLGVK